MPRTGFRFKAQGLERFGATLWQGGAPLGV
jgi:hypothetical protein